MSIDVQGQARHELVRSNDVGHLDPDPQTYLSDDLRANRR
jgi:hypothetical protein